MPHLPGFFRRLDGDISEFLSIRQGVDGDIRDKDRATTTDQQRNTQQVVTFFGINHPGNVFQCRVVIPGGPGDHGICITQRNHAGCEDVPVLIDQALAITAQQTTTLHPLVKEVSILLVGV